IPQAPVSDEARKHNQSLPGQGGVYNLVNFQLYHYAGNNPVKYVDPTGMWIDNGDGTYTVETGDTLYSLAKLTTGDGKNWVNYGYTEEQAKNLKVGDIVNARVFSSEDEAAKAWSASYMGASISADVEYGSTIYTVKTPDGSIKYSYTNPVVGTVNTVSPSWPTDRSKVVAFIHSHGASTTGFLDYQFSNVTTVSGTRNGDIPYADYYGINGYLVRPDLVILKYIVGSKSTVTVP
ncbi:DUF4329 domain-containing protein, partial [Spirochaetia bacterium 38H-sp]